MRKNENKVHIEGRIYQHDLEVKTVKNKNSENFGKNFIGGTIEVATDEAGMNIIPVNFTYVTETTKAGGKNKTYAELMKIITLNNTWLTKGPEEAMKVSIDTTLAVNDFVAKDGTMVSQPIHNGGFVSIIAELNENEAIRNTFKADVVITNVVMKDADPEKNIDCDHAVVRGLVFDFRNAVHPIDFVISHPAGMKYFESLDASPSNPIYTNVWGRINFKNISTEIKQESAFGEAAVTVRKRKEKKWEITGSNKIPYEFGEENVMTTTELMKALQDREVYLAGVKKQREEYEAAKKAETTNSFVAPGNGFTTVLTADSANAPEFVF